MAHVPSLPPELMSIVARFLEPSAWSTARALSKGYRDAVHERTKDPAALDELLWHMHSLESTPLLINYGTRDPKKELLERHFPHRPNGESHNGFVRLSLRLMLDLAEYVAYDRDQVRYANQYKNGYSGNGRYVHLELRNDTIQFIDSRVDVEEVLKFALDEKQKEPELWSTLRWVMLRMVDRVRFGSCYFERTITNGNPTRRVPLIWEMK